MTRRELTLKIIQCVYLRKEGHIPSALSILDCVNVIAKNFTLKPFVLSKGHGSLALYVVMFDQGLITEEEFFSFGGFDSCLGGHPTFEKLPIVKVSTGSLGHGLPFSVGLAWGQKIQNKDEKVFCLIGDGEANEGTIWEAALIASTHKLDNLVCLMDFNRSGERAIQLVDCIDKFKAFGWTSFTVNGHDPKEILTAIKEPTTTPKFIQLNTTKGKGCKIIENNPEWHHKFPSSQQEYQLLIDSVYED